MSSLIQFNDLVQESELLLTAYRKAQRLCEKKQVEKLGSVTLSSDENYFYYEFTISEKANGRPAHNSILRLAFNRKNFRDVQYQWKN